MFSALKSKGWEIKRRVEQKTVEALGKAEASSDVEFDQLTAQFKEAENLLETVYTRTKNFVDGLAKLTEASTAMAESYGNAFLAAHGTNQFGGSELSSAALAINKYCQEKEKLLAAKALEPLRKWVESFRGVKTRMEELHKARLDFDYYQRKVQGLKENPKTDKATMDDKLAKLSRTQHAYEEGLFKLKLELATLMEKMSDVLHTPFACLVSAQVDMLKAATGAMGPLQPYYVSEPAAGALKPFLPEDLASLVGQVATERAAAHASQDFPLPPANSAPSSEPALPAPSAPPAPPAPAPAPVPAAAAPGAVPMTPDEMEKAMQAMAAQMASMGFPAPPVPPASAPAPPASSENPFSS
eukprot:tig00001542_g9326.t1